MAGPVSLPGVLLSRRSLELPHFVIWLLICLVFASLAPLGLLSGTSKAFQRRFSRASAVSVG